MGTVGITLRPFLTLTFLQKMTVAYALSGLWQNNSRVGCPISQASKQASLITLANFRSLIVDALLEEIRGQNDMACVYYYSQGDDNQSPEHIWATFLIQLLHSHGYRVMAQEVVHQFDISLQGSTTLHPSEYINLLKAQAAEFKTVYLIIDDLDNFPESPGRSSRQVIMKDLEDMPDSVRVLFTSRQAGEGQQLRIEPKEGDIHTYVKGRVQSNTVLNGEGATAVHRQEAIKEVTKVTLTSKMSVQCSTQLAM